MKKMKAKKGEKQCSTILNCCKSSFLSFDILKFYNIFAIALHWKTSVLLCRHHAWPVKEPVRPLRTVSAVASFVAYATKLSVVSD